MASSETEDVAERRVDLLLGIEQHEVELREAMHELAEVAETNLNPSEYIRRYPLAWVAGAFCMGLWLGFGGRRNATTFSLSDLKRRLR